jgi:hypothetical protein
MIQQLSQPIDLIELVKRQVDSLVGDIAAVIVDDETEPSTMRLQADLYEALAAHCAERAKLTREAI